MNARTARATAARWVEQQASGLPGFLGAYLSGSTATLPADAEVPATSDVDVCVVLAGDAPAKLGKFRYRGALLEVTYVAAADLADAGEVLSTFYLAGSFRTDTILADPTGVLRRLHVRVAGGFADPHWVRRRCAGAFARIETVSAVEAARPWPEQVTAWLFPTSVTALVPLIAGLRNPTVRLRYVAAGELLAERGHSDVYADLLGLLGCADLTAARVGHHLDALARTFDATAAVARTAYFFSSDLTPDARPVAIDGGRALVAGGLHREAVFWIVATFARCHTALAADAPELGHDLAPAFAEVLADLGLATPTDLRRRAGEVVAFLPRLRATAEAILASD